MNYLVIFLTIILLPGCATFNDEYTCGAIPEAGCTPVSEVYDKTSGNVYDYRKDLNKTNQKDNNKEEIKTPVINISSAHRVMNYVNPGDPILTKPVVMRVLYRSFENDQKDLDAGGYTYLRMRDSEWVTQQ